MSKGFVSFQFCFPIILLQKTFNYKASFSGCKKIILRILCNTIQLLISVRCSLKIRLIIFLISLNVSNKKRAGGLSVCRCGYFKSPNVNIIVTKPTVLCAD